MSITTGLDAIIAPHTGDLADPADVGVLFDAMVTHLTDRHRIAPRFTTRGPSRENWRLEKRPKISAHNRSPEKTLEKKLVGLLDETWANMVPTASGLWDENADKQRNLDLVNRVDAGVYEFIELKIGSDTPRSAAIQLATYAAMFVVAAALHWAPASDARRARGPAASARACAVLRSPTAPPSARRAAPRAPAMGDDARALTGSVIRLRLVPERLSVAWLAFGRGSPRRLSGPRAARVAEPGPSAVRDPKRTVLHSNDPRAHSSPHCFPFPHYQASFCCQMWIYG